MLLISILLVVMASALRPFELKQGVYELIGLTAGALALGSQLLAWPIAVKLALNGGVALDNDGLLGLFVLGGSVMVLLSGWAENLPSPAIVAVLITASAMLLLSQVSSLALVFLELQSYASYTIVALGSIEAYRQVSAAIYLLVGALATAAFVVGWAELHHVGELTLARMPASGHAGQAFQVAGLLTKIGCFPFGLWLATAYGGITWPTLGTIAVLPQVPLAAQVWGLNPTGLAMIYLLAVASVAFGGLLSACTPHLRPLIAFSGIAHAGYLLSGAGLALYPIFLYSFVYTLMFTLFCLTVAGQDIQLTTMRLSSLRGSSNLFVLSATTLQVAAFSLGGMPPLLGFFSKSYVLLEGICLANSFVQPILLMALGAVGIVAYLRLALATVGYPQTFSYLLHPGLKAVDGGGPRALLLGLVLLLELLSGDLSFALLV